MLQIFQWVSQDLGVSPEAVLAFIGKYIPVDGAELRQGKWKIRYFGYEWGINESQVGGAG